MRWKKGSSCFRSDSAPTRYNQTRTKFKSKLEIVPDLVCITISSLRKYFHIKSSSDWRRLFANARDQLKKFQITKIGEVDVYIAKKTKSRFHARRGQLGKTRAVLMRGVMTLHEPYTLQKNVINYLEATSIIFANDTLGVQDECSLVFCRLFARSPTLLGGFSLQPGPRNTPKTNTIRCRWHRSIIIILTLMAVIPKAFQVFIIKYSPAENSSKNFRYISETALIFNLRNRHFFFKCMTILLILALFLLLKQILTTQIQAHSKYHKKSFSGRYSKRCRKIIKHDITGKMKSWHNNIISTKKFYCFTATQSRSSKLFLDVHLKLWVVMCNF